MKPDRRTLTVGRDRTCDIPIADDSVSRLHAEVAQLDDGRWLVRDRQSSNGTRLIRGGRSTLVREEVIAAGDAVQFGSVVLAFEDLLDAARPRARPREARREAPKGAAVPKLVRCECGIIKLAGKVCPSCGQ